MKALIGAKMLHTKLTSICPSTTNLNITIHFAQVAGVDDDPQLYY